MIKWIRRRSEGGIGLVALGLILFLLLLWVAFVNIGSLYLSNKSIQSKLQRAVNCAATYAMKDDYRADYILRIDSDIASEQLEIYIEDDLDVDSSGSYYKDGKMQYKINIEDTEITEVPPQIKISGTIELTTPFSLFDREWSVSYPFEITSTNTDLVY